MAHTPVLLQEVLEILSPQAGEVFLDGTVGSGGHALELSQKLGSTGHLICLDQDQSSLVKAKETLKGVKCKTSFHLANFRHLDKVLAELGLTQVDGILLDLGVHSDQIGPSGRGFSFMHDEPLLMTMKEGPTESDLTAKDVVNSWEEDNLVAILRGFGEETFAPAIAKAIVEARHEKDIETTGELVEIIRGAVPAWYTHKRLHFATRTFQALRLAVNDELGALKEGLTKGWESLAPGGRFGVISFHSLESRLVKNIFIDKKGEGPNLLTKHAIQATREEELSNPRSRSAELRVIKKI